MRHSAAAHSIFRTGRTAGIYTSVAISSRYRYRYIMTYIQVAVLSSPIVLFRGCGDRACGMQTIWSRTGYRPAPWICVAAGCRCDAGLEVFNIFILDSRYYVVGSRRGADAEQIGSDPLLAEDLLDYGVVEGGIGRCLVPLLPLLTLFYNFPWPGIFRYYSLWFGVH